MSTENKQLSVHATLSKCRFKKSFCKKTSLIFFFRGAFDGFTEVGIKQVSLAIHRSAVEHFFNLFFRKSAEKYSECVKLTAELATCSPFFSSHDQTYPDNKFKSQIIQFSTLSSDIY